MAAATESAKAWALYSLRSDLASTTTVPIPAAPCSDAQAELLNTIWGALESVPRFCDIPPCTYGQLGLQPAIATELLGEAMWLQYYPGQKSDEGD